MEHSKRVKQHNQSGSSGCWGQLDECGSGLKGECTTGGPRLDAIGESTSIAVGALASEEASPAVLESRSAPKALTLRRSDLRARTFSACFSCSRTRSFSASKSESRFAFEEQKRALHEYSSRVILNGNKANISNTQQSSQLAAGPADNLIPRAPFVSSQLLPSAYEHLRAIVENEM